MSFGFGLGFPKLSALAGGFSPAALFTQGEQGVWYDPSDVNVAWRRNLLTYTEQFDNAAWQKLPSGAASTPVVTADVGTAPDGTSTADRVQLALNGGTTTGDRALVAQSVTLATSTTYTYSIWLRSRGATVSMGIGVDNVVGNTPITVTSSWQRFTVTGTATGTSGLAWFQLRGGQTPTQSNSADLDVWGAQLELGSTATAYQQIVTPEITYVATVQSQPVLFQDSAGTTPVTAIEQPVGLMLDKSKGLVLGPQLVTNGDFSSGTTGWTASNATLSVVSGALQITGGTGGNGYAYQAFSTQANNQYLVTFDTTFGTETNALCWIGTSIGASDVASLTWTVAGSKTLRFTAVGSTTYIRIGQNTPTTGLTLFFDNVSVKLLPGNHATQSTSTKRPLLSARVNLLTKTEAFDDAVWIKSGAGVGTVPVVTANQAVAPDGTTTADLVALVNTGTTASDWSWLYQNFSAAANITYTSSAWVKAAAPADIGKIIIFAGATTGAIVTLTADWQRVSQTSTTVSAGTISIGPRLRGTETTATSVSFFLWGADLRVTNTGVNLPVYQAVNTSTDYATAGFPLFLRADGVDDAMASNSVDFTGTDKMTVWSGVRKLSDAASGVLTELSADWNLNTGTFISVAPDGTGASGDYAAASRGTASSNINQIAKSAVTLAPVTNVFTATHDIAGNLSAIRLNGSASGTNATGSKGTGNFGNYPLYIGARGGTSIFFNGNIYSLIIRGAQCTASQISATESWVNGKTKAY